MNATESQKLADEQTQTANGGVKTLPSLYIPGETGELLGLANELKTPDIDDNQVAIFGKTKLNQIYAQIEAKKIKYKAQFTTAVITILLIAYATTLFPWFLLYYHTVMFPVLYIIRIIVFRKNHWQAFCLDFCYSVNIMAIIFIWAFPESETLLAVIFGAACGPVAVALALFRNSLVFHDYDRLTSVYIHIMPNILVYVIRWMPTETSRFWYFHPNKTLTDVPMYRENESKADAYWIWIVAVPLAWFALHTIMVTMLEKCCFEDEKYFTMSRYLSKDATAPMYNILTFCGRLTRELSMKLAWVVFNIIYAALSLLIARLSYQYQIVHSVYIAALLTLIIYNGASFYIDVVSKRGLKVVNN